MDGLSGDNSWCLQLNSGTLVGHDRALTIDSVTERVDNSSEHAFTNGNIYDRSGSLDDIALLNLSAQSQQNSG